MKIQEKAINLKCSKVLKRKQLKVFDKYDGNYMDPKVGDI